jgi:hypothetical protein
MGWYRCCWLGFPVWLVHVLGFGDWQSGGGLREVDILE